ncbi:MAG: class I SAM-dependent methyltransferase [Deltaproteobacteria bacterium]|jgi:SAM-dependent methyltransferase|nr:class I SAM-dependent methyltransferase [Deltaproteobacteria bacterium]
MEQNNFNITFPEVNDAHQGTGEHFFIERDGEKKKIIYHDYDKIYSIPGLYEELFYDKLKCDSPAVVAKILNDFIKDSPIETSDLKVLDIGAGNGIMGEELKRIGAGPVIGLDIIEEAADSALRDRPEVYEDYYVADLMDLEYKDEKSLEKADFNCMTIIAALGFDDIPPKAFAAGFNLISSPGLFAFNIKEDFMDNKDKTGFCKLISKMVDEDILEIKKRHHYRHRLLQDGTPLYYYAVVGEKKRDIPESML